MDFTRECFETFDKINVYSTIMYAFKSPRQQSRVYRYMNTWGLEDDQGAKANRTIHMCQNTLYIAFE